MRKKFLALLMALVSVCTVSAGNGFYVGVGGALQSNPVYDGTRISFAPAAEVGYKGYYFNLSGQVSAGKDVMFSFDVNSYIPLAENVNVIFGGGYGYVYCKTEYQRYGEIYTSSDYVSWPHGNVGAEFGLSDNLGIRVVGALGYGRWPDGYYYRDRDYHDYRYDDWRFAAQVRAVLTWTF